MKILLLLLNLTFCLSFGQNLENELFGFKIGQYRDAVQNKFGKPFQLRTFDDGYEAEIYLVKKDTTAYAVFEYAPSDKNVIWSIQLYGADKSINPRFKNLKMGISKDKLIEILGDPENTKDAGEHGEMLEYKNSNYSFEINTQNQLSSIKLVDTYREYYPQPEPKKIPSFKVISDILLSGNKLKISNILSPSLEISRKSKIVYFGNSWNDERESDLSGIYKLLKQITKGIDEIDISDINQYEENLRLEVGQDSKHVIKIKKGSPIKEIVMRYEFGKYLIWEIKT